MHFFSFQYMSNITPPSQKRQIYNRRLETNFLAYCFRIHALRHVYVPVSSMQIQCTKYKFRHN